MKRFVFWQILIAALLMAPNSQAQSLKDLLNKENIEKAVNAITGKSTASMEGTWTYAGSAIEFESDNLLQKAGGAVAANAAENKLNEQLARVGIKEGQMSFTFNADSTFTAKVGAKSIKGTYSYDASTQNASLKFMKLIPLNAKINCTSANMDLLFILVSADRFLVHIGRADGLVGLLSPFRLRGEIPRFGIFFSQRVTDNGFCRTDSQLG